MNDAAGQRNGSPSPSTSGSELPSRATLLTGGTVLTMDPELGDLPRGDVLVREGAIVEIGPAVKAPDAERIDVSGCIVMPGIIDTHWHLWNTLLRAMATTEAEQRYFPLLARYGPAFDDQATYAATRLALAEAAYCGVTTVADWAHNVRGPSVADATLQAHVDSSLRTRLYYAYREGHDDHELIDLADVDRVASRLAGGAAPLTSLGLGLRNPAMYPTLDWRSEWDFARDRALPTSTHVADRAEADAIGLLAAEGRLGPSLQLVHGIDVTGAERRLLAESGTSVSVSPWSELIVGFGYPDLAGMAADEVCVSLSTDTTALVGNADPFATMRLALAIAHGSARDEGGLSARRVLRMATADAAADLGLGHLVGSLTVGRQADITILRHDRLNSVPAMDPAQVVVLCAAPRDVEHVFVDGRAVKRDGVSLLPEDAIVAEAHDAIQRVQARVAA